MKILIIATEIILFTLLVLVGSFRAERPQHSGSKIKLPKSEKENLQSKELLVKHYRLVNGAKALLYGLITVFYVVLLTTQVSGVWLFFAPIITLYLSYLLARSVFIGSISQKLFLLVQHRVVDFFDKYQNLLGFFIKKEPKDKERRISTIDELSEIIKNSDNYLSSKQIDALMSALSFCNLRAKDIMVKRPKLVTIKSSDVLGPIALNELSKFKQEYAIVVGKGVDDVKGLLHLESLLIIEGGENNLGTALDAAIKPVYYVNQSSELDTALAVLVDNRQTALIVVDENKKTVGLITLTAILGKLIPLTDGQI